MKIFACFLLGVLAALTGNAQARDIRIDGSLSPAEQNNWLAQQEWQSRATITICGEATTINNNTVYYGPSVTLVANAPYGQSCSITATGNTTEASADAPALTRQPYRVLSMLCRNQADADANITFTFRNNTKFTTPKVTCTIPDGERDCVSDPATTPLDIIPAAAPIAIAANSTGNIADGNGFMCTMQIAY